MASKNKPALPLQVKSGKLHIALQKILVQVTSRITISYRWLAIFMGLFLLLSFRNAVIDIPNQIAQESFVAFDELIPIFDWETQFWDQLVNGYSNLTETNEIRIRYSAMTTWTRYYPLLSLSLVLVNLLSFLIFVYSGHRLLDLIYREDKLSYRQKLILSTLANFPIFIILLYNKVTHYYTLILGAALFVLAAIITLEILLQQKTKRFTWVLLFLIVLLNPAVHYHILYFLVVGILILVTWLNNLLSRQKWQALLINTGKVITLVAVATAIYGLFLFTGGSGYSSSNLNSVAAVNVPLIKNSSASIEHILSLDMFSPLDNYNLGEYLPQYPRLVNSLLFMLTAIVAILLAIPLFRKWTFVPEKFRLIYLISTIFALVGIYFSLGLEFDGTPYSLVINSIESSFFNGLAGQLVLNIAQLFVQVIRFPHRFQFFYLMGLAMQLVLALALIYRGLKYRVPMHWRFKTGLNRAALFSAVIIFIVPFFNYDILNTVVLSGNWQGAFQPFSVSDFQSIKSIIPADSKVFYAPYLEFNSFIVEDNTRHKFIDKFWLYLINKPSEYYGLGGDLDNKMQAFLFYRAALFEDKWWLKVLQDADFDHIVLVKDVKSNTFDTDSSIERAIKASSSLRKLYESDRFIVYTFDKKNNEKSLLTMLNWQNYIKLMNENSSINNRKFYYNFGLDNGNIGNADILTDDAPGLPYLVEATEHPERTYTISNKELTFRSDIYPASFYQASAVSLFNTLDDDIRNNKIGSSFPSIILKSNNNFAATPGKFNTEITINVKNRCQLVLSSINANNSIAFNLYRGKELVAKDFLELSDKDRVTNNLEFHKVNIPELEAGTYTLQILKEDTNPFVLNYIMCADTDYQKNLNLVRTEEISLSNGQKLEIYTKK